MTTFGERLRYLKDRKDVTFRQMAKDTGINVTSLQKYALGTMEPRLSRMEWIADYFGVSLDYLAGRESP